MEPLDDWQRLLLRFKEGNYFYRSTSHFTRIHGIAGDQIRITWDLYYEGSQFTALVTVNVTRAVTVTSIILLIEESVAYVAVEEENDLELIYRKMPDVWQLYGAEDDTTLSLSERRAQEIPYMLR